MPHSPDSLIRRAPAYDRLALVANILIMTAGFVLMGYQLGGLAYGDPL